jgi:hypothetical protein
MKYFVQYLLLIVTLFFTACKNNTIDLSGNEKIDMKILLKAFKPLKLPLTIADTSIYSITDTTTIGYKALAQFIPDTAMQSVELFKKNTIIKAVGKIEKKEELYLLIVVTDKKKQTLVTFIFNKQNEYKAIKKLLSSQNTDDYVHSVSINKEPTFIISKEKINSQTKLLQFTRMGWAFNSENDFIVVLNDSNEDEKKTSTILNPIDTLPKKNKLSGDYIENAKNYMSIRDGKNDKEYLFFIHFEKKEGACVGELKGKFILKDETHAKYTENGDPCVIDFTFNGNEVTLKEQGSCGNRRGIECYFDDSFIKKKEPKPKKKKA